ncbi:hypothetical protein ACFYUH_25000 [Streptomyces fimicarius]|uniref:hypothetical protein n=1 Tax=Streptomyces griseus TaxID=1911 RepID=UPI0036B4C764
MSDLGKAARDAVEAQANSEQVALILAVLQAQQLAQPQQPPAPPAVRPAGSAAKWVGIGVGGSIFLVAFALSAVAVAISAVALTICVLVLRSVWQDTQRGR